MPESIEEVDAPLGLGMLDADPDRQKFLLECMWNEETGFETLQ